MDVNAYGLVMSAQGRLQQAPDRPLRELGLLTSPASSIAPTSVRVIVVESCDLLCLDLDAAEAIRGALDADGAARLAGTLKAFSDPTRLLIVQALAQRELCGCDLGWITGQSDKVVSHHLGRLRRYGLVSSRREGKIVFASLTEHGRALLERVEAIAAA
jgi:ArsR family transcriptional regulator, lead/cadmium/zinc/bismuth-responsive transcriptional repressor